MEIFMNAKLSFHISWNEWIVYVMPPIHNYLIMLIGLIIIFILVEVSIIGGITIVLITQD